VKGWICLAFGFNDILKGAFAKSRQKTDVFQ